MNKTKKLAASVAFAVVSLCGLATVVAGVTGKKPDVQPVVPSMAPSVARVAPSQEAPAPPPPTANTPAEEEQEAHTSVHPGSFCSPAGAVGVYRGTTYTCKGPKPYRWRR